MCGPLLVPNMQTHRRTQKSSAHRTQDVLCKPLPRFEDSSVPMLVFQILKGRCGEIKKKCNRIWVCVPFTMLCARHLTRQVLTTAQMLRALNPPKLRHFESANSNNHCAPVTRKSTPRAATKLEFTGMAYCYDIWSPAHRYHAWKPQKLTHHRPQKSEIRSAPVPRKSLPRAANWVEFTGMAYCYAFGYLLHGYGAWKLQKFRHYISEKFQNSLRACSTKVHAASRHLARTHGHGLLLSFLISIALLRCLETSEV